MAVRLGMKRMPWKATGKDMGMHDKYCYELDRILLDMDELDNKTYWCITNKFHDYMKHSVYENERPLGNYLFQLHNEGVDTLELCVLFDKMREDISKILPDPTESKKKHDYTESKENLYTLFLSSFHKCYYTTISRN